MPAAGRFAATSSRDTGSQRALRELNTRKILDVLAGRGPRTQAELARVTGLSTGTVSNIVRGLVSDGRALAAPVVSSGRRSVQVSLAPDRRVVVGIDIGRSHLRLLGCDAAHRTFGLRSATLEPGHRPAQTLRAAADMLDAMLQEEEICRSRVQVCGIALPAALDPVSRMVIQESVLPNWAGQDLGALSASVLGLPTVLENDANLGALAHVSFGRHPSAHSLVYIKVATGIGAGIALDGQLYRSSSGLTGEIGHFQVVDGGEVCYCGNRGCLETVGSTRRVVTDLAHIRHGDAVTLDDVVAAAEAAEPAILRILEDAGAALGRAVALVCTLLSPDVVVLGGPLTRVGGPMLEALVRSVRQRALPSATAATVFELSDLGADAEVQGACELALQEMLWTTAAVPASTS